MISNDRIVLLQPASSPCFPLTPHFLSHHGVDNGDAEERGGKRIMREGEKFSSAKVTCQLAACQLSHALPLNLPSTNWYTVQGNTKENVWFLLHPFWTSWTLLPVMSYQMIHYYISRSRCIIWLYSTNLHSALRRSISIKMELPKSHAAKEILQCNYFSHKFHWHLLLTWGKN